MKKRKHIDKSILDLVRKQRVVTTSEAANELNVSWNTAEKHMMELLVDGKLLRLKKAGVNLWVLK